MKKVGELSVDELLKIAGSRYPEIYGIEIFCQVTGLTKSTAYKLTSERKVPHFKRPGSSKVYFRHNDVIAWLTEYPVPTMEEMADQAIK